MKAMEILLQGQRMLQEAGIQVPRLEAEMLLAFLLRCQRHDLYLNREKQIPMQAVGNFFELIRRRIKGEPIQYIIGCQEFMGMDFRVDQRVLIPRRDTEILVEHVIRVAREMKGPVHVVELGTGSGAIAVSLAANLPEARVTAIDIDSGALEVAKENAALHRVQERIAFLQGDLFEPLKDGHWTGSFDVLVSNPPYIPTVEIETLEVQVKDYEPRIALDGGRDGLDFYRRLASLAPAYLKPGALWAVEVGYNQAAAVRGLLEKVGLYAEIQLLKDLSGIDRVVSARFACDRGRFSVAKEPATENRPLSQCRSNMTLKEVNIC